MRRRLHVVGAAVVVGLMVLLGGTALAAGQSKAKTKSAPGTRVSCASATSIAIPAGADTVLPPAQAGAEYGTVRCGKLLGPGVQEDRFTMPTSGDTLATFWLYFHAGAVHGTYDLTPQTGALNFLETDWIGTLKIVGGTGAYTGAKGTGTMTCKTPDGIHTTCTEKLKLKTV